MSGYEMIMEILIPVIGNIGLVVVFYLLDRYTGFKEKPYIFKQAVIGVCFGAVCILASHFGLQLEDTLSNVRDSSPLLAGLVFGAPAGIISGIIGGVYRWFSVFWGAGTYTQLACSLAVVLAGFVAAALRKLMFDNKKPNAFYGAGIAMVCEIVHMLLIFFTNMDDTVRAFDFVVGATIPMTAANALTVGAAIAVISVLGKKSRPSGQKQEQLAQTFQRWLLICIVIAFAATGVFTYAMQTNMSIIRAGDEIDITIDDVHSEIVYASDQNLLKLAHKVRDLYVSDPRTDFDSLYALADSNDVSEINIIDSSGIIIGSTMSEFIGYDMRGGEQSGEFMILIDDDTVDEYAQLYGPTSYDNSLYRKYAAVMLPDGGFLQVGYDSEIFQRTLNDIVIDSTKNRHIGGSGFVAICDEDWKLIIDTDYSGVELKSLGIDTESNKRLTDKVYEAEVTGIYADDTGNVTHLYSYDYVEGYIVIGAVSMDSAMFMRDVSVYVSVFMEIIIFAILFVLIYFLIKKLVINNLCKVNASLSEITDGNLNVTVDVRSNQEFASLSDDINSTVSTLKRYIAEAAARIDKELEYAKQIQLSALPSVFPDNERFGIYAQMIAAKEVGGDFYDFYTLNEHTVAFLAADVSGKGIPAAMFMMTAKTMLKDLAESGAAVNDVFTKANEKLCENNESNMFVTAWMGVLDLNTGVLKFANAGHNPPLLLHTDGSCEYLKSRAGFVLAGMEGIRYRLNEITLSQGDRVFLYTDGVTEATNSAQELYGEERLAEYMRSHIADEIRPLLHGLKADIDGFVGEAPQFDDITMLIVDYNFGKDLPPMVEKSFPADENYLDVVLAFVEEELDKAECALKTVMALTVAIEEVFVNVAHYAYGEDTGEVRLGISYDAPARTVTFVLTDKGIPFDPLAKPDPDTTLSADERQVGGLGIFITKKTMDKVEYRYENNENVLTMTKKI